MLDLEEATLVLQSNSPLNPLATNPTDLLDQHADPICDLDSPLQDDQSNLQDSQVSPVTAAGAPSIHSQWDNDLQSAVTARGAQSIASHGHDVAPAIASPTATSCEHHHDDLSVSTNQSSKHSGASLDLSTPPLHCSPRT